MPGFASAAALALWRSTRLWAFTRPESLRIRSESGRPEYGLPHPACYGGQGHCHGSLGHTQRRPGTTPSEHRRGDHCLAQWVDDSKETDMVPHHFLETYTMHLEEHD